MITNTPLRWQRKKAASVCLTARYSENVYNSCDFCKVLLLYKVYEAQIFGKLADKRHLGCGTIAGANQGKEPHFQVLGAGTLRSLG